MDIFVLLLLISSFSSLLAYYVLVLVFFLLSQAYFEGEFFVCNTLNRCIYTQQIYFSHFLVIFCRSVANTLFTSKQVLNIEFSQSSSCYLLKSNLSIACPISEASTCEAPNFFLNSANLITRTNSTGLKCLQLCKDMCRKMSLGLLKCIV